jgi:ribonuclease HII
MYIGIILPIKKFTKNIFEDSKKLTEKQREELFAQIENI